MGSDNFVSVPLLSCTFLGKIYEHPAANRQVIHSEILEQQFTPFRRAPFPSNRCLHDDHTQLPHMFLDSRQYLPLPQYTAHLIAMLCSIQCSLSEMCFLHHFGIPNLYRQRLHLSARTTMRRQFTTLRCT